MTALASRTDFVYRSDKGERITIPLTHSLFEKILGVKEAYEDPGIPHTVFDTFIIPAIKYYVLHDNKVRDTRETSGMLVVFIQDCAIQRKRGLPFPGIV